MRVFVQQKGGRFPNINYYNAALGFEELGGEVVPVEEAELEAADESKEALVVGEIPIMLAAFARRGVAYEPFSYIPQCCFHSLDAGFGHRRWERFEAALPQDRLCSQNLSKELRAYSKARSCGLIATSSGRQTAMRRRRYGAQISSISSASIGSFFAKGPLSASNTILAIFVSL